MTTALLTVDAVPSRLPADGEPVFTGAPPFPGSPIPRFGDEVWSLEFFNANPANDAITIHWAGVPPAFRPHLKLAAWALFNVPFPDEIRQAHATKVRATLSAFSIYRTVTRWTLLARWLAGRGVTSFADLTPETMGDYVTALRVERGLSANSVTNDMTAILRLWVIGQQLPTIPLAGAPPWLTGGRDDYLPVASAGGENTTEPIAAATMAALLQWALTTVETCAEPVLAAHRFRLIPEEVAAQGSRARDGAARLDAYLERLKATGAPIPARQARDRSPIDAFHVACLNHVTVATARAWANRDEVRRYAAHHHTQAAIDLGLSQQAAQILTCPVTVQSIPALVGLLEAACFTVIAYLTGMRTGEVLALEAGSLQPSSHDGGWMLIHSRHFKTVRDEHGNHDSRGELRPTPWVAVAPVVQAIRTMEILRGGHGLLFPAVWRSDRKRLTRARSRSAISDSIARFVDHINTRHPGAIPADPQGAIAPVRFRRTLAWHLANQPRGLVAVAIQYGHLSTAIAEGYANRTRDGLQELIDFETARSIAIHLSQAHEDMRNGDSVSGPAAARFVAALQEQRHQFNGLVTSHREATTLLRNQRLTVFQNEKTFLWCHFRREGALCLNGADTSSTTTPRLDNCKPTCGNIARTDKQATSMRAEATRLTRQAELLPGPAADRLTAHAAAMLTHADRHDAQRRNCEDLDAQP